MSIAFDLGQNNLSGRRLPNAPEAGLRVPTDAAGIAHCRSASRPVPALAHSWYPLACCGSMDCFPIACDQLVETVSGWLYVPTGNLFKREQVQPSQDHHCHLCLGRGIDHHSICAFIVPNV